MMTPPYRKEMMERLNFFVGRWTVEVFHPHLQPSPIKGETKFEWLDEAYIIQHTHIDKTEFPSSTIIFDWDPSTGHYVQHYFDSRGVTRLYEMSFDERLWKLWRDASDFSPLDFHQRFTGTIDPDANRIDCAWEGSEDGLNWNHDFQIVFTRRE